MNRPLARRRFSAQNVGSRAVRPDRFATSTAFRQNNMDMHTTRDIRRLAIAALTAAFAAGCATEPPPAPKPVEPPPVQVAPTPAPAPLVPELPPAQAKAEAQKL